MLAKAILAGWQSLLDELNADFSRYGFHTMAEAIVLSSFDPDKAATVDASTRQAIWAHLLAEGDDFRQFGLYNLPHCGVMAKRSKAVKKYIAKHGESCFHDPDVDVATLSIMSQLFSDYSDMVVYPIKVFVMSKGITGEYDGFHPNTSPCRDATSFLVDDAFRDNALGHRDFCRDLAKEMGITPTDANSFLYLFGTYLRK